MRVAVITGFRLLANRLHAPMYVRIYTHVEGCIICKEGGIKELRGDVSGEKRRKVKRSNYIEEEISSGKNNQAER